MTNEELVTAIRDAAAALAYSISPASAEQREDAGWLRVRMSTIRLSLLSAIDEDPKSVFWADHERDMQDPEYRAAFAEAQTRQLAAEAGRVMEQLAAHGEGIVGHLLDDDDNAGERLRTLLREVSRRSSLASFHSRRADDR